MADETRSADAEFSAMQTLSSALEPLDEGARRRAVSYIVARLGIAAPATFGTAPQRAEDSRAEEEEPAIKGESVAPPSTYSTFAELYDAAQPTTTALRALVAGYWLQACQGGESFDGQSANAALKHLGHGLPNITNAIDSLKNQKPALALQLKKSGKTQQARKTYKLTTAGLRAVEEMING